MAKLEIAERKLCEAATRFAVSKTDQRKRDLCFAAVDYVVAWMPVLATMLFKASPETTSGGVDRRTVWTSPPLDDAKTKRWVRHAKVSEKQSCIKK